MDCAVKQNYFEQKLSTLSKQGISNDDAILDVIEAYLDGKPKPAKSKKQKTATNDQLFWSSVFLWDLSVEVISSEAFILALARYFSVEKISNFSLFEQITYRSPESMRKAIRASEIVLRPSSNKWTEIKQLASRIPGELSELVAVCSAFQHSHQERVDLVVKYQQPFKDLSVFELLSYSSVYAFKYLFNEPDAFDGSVISTGERFCALKEIAEWKLRHAEHSSFNLTEVNIGKSLKIHQSPLVFPSQEDSSIPEYFLHHFEKLMQAQVELDGFLSRCVTPFCFDDECGYYLEGERLEMRKDTFSEQRAWDLNGKKQNLIDGYWVMRGGLEFKDRGLDKQLIGSVENHDDNQIAYIKSLGAYLQLSDIYGIDNVIQTDNGLKVDVHQALLSLELMIAFYNKDYIKVFATNLHETGDWKTSLGMLALSGLIDPNNLQNRFPITFCNWKEKAKNIVGWTVSKDFPKGNINAAEAILDFWSFDCKKWSTQLQANNHENMPQLTERPIFKLGNYSVQLPWMMAGQLTSVNVINTLRRFANKRPEIRSETQRIETNLGNQFKKRGFTVIEGYEPDRTDDFNPGEIDLICVLDNTVIVVEVKSTYRRTSKREVIRYKHSALRKAGQQIKRKTEAVKYLLETDDTFRELLGIKQSEESNVVGWIADTSLEYDHEYFNGYLKISVEELHIALRDEAEMLVDLVELIDEDNRVGSLYLDGFSATSFVGVIEHSKLWAYSL
ncbi:NERD domain-containing protein [Psychromonas arctica]|uniref:NERD domain-containing protein n=1 Tax=Psychromonas arctica TaxID=168275 RepID=UPI00040D505E|nr:NERD domain-containing protein [Psychromonas arctica]